MAAGDQVAVPAQHRVRAHQQPQPAQHVARQPVQQRGQERPVSRVEPHPLLAQLAFQHRDLMAQRGMYPGRGGPAHRCDVGAGGGTFGLPGDVFGVAGAEPVQRRQERPLVGVRLERAEVEEGGQSVLAASALQRRGDEVAEAALGQDVLVGEQPVVRPQVHRSA